MRRALILAALAAAAPAAAEAATGDPVVLSETPGAGDASPDAATPPLPLPPPDPLRTGSVKPERPAENEPPVAPVRRTPPDLDPYEPLGIHVGSFILYPSVTIGAGYTTNAPAAAGGAASGYVSVTPELKVRSDWARHELTLTLRGSSDRFFSDAAADKPSASLEAGARLDLADGWQANLDGSYAVERKSVTNAVFPPDSDPTGEVRTLSGDAGITRNLGPAAITLAARATRTTYGVATGGGVTLDQSDRDNVDYGARVRLAYEVTPALSPFVEAEVSRRSFDQAVDSNGIARASRGVAVRAGVAIDTGPLLAGEVAIGAQRQTFADPALADIAALTVDGSLTWAPTPLVTVTADLSTAINPGTDPASSGSVEYDASLETTYAWRDNIDLSVNAGLVHERFQGTGENDRTYSVGAGITWKINRYLRLTGSYTHEWLVSNDAASNYTADGVRVDLKVQR